MNLFTKKKLFLLLVLLILILSSVNLTVGVSAPDEALLSSESDCKRVQVLIMIDHSTSMIDRNDPNQLRDYAPLHIFDLIARNYLNATSNPDILTQPKKVELAVVRFASSATTGLNWTSVTPSSEEARDQLRETLKDKLELSYEDERALGEKIGNGTNFIRAFDYAADMFAGVPEEGCPERIILLITDGQPDRAGEPLMGDDLEAHMEEVESIAEDHFWVEGTKIYVTGINVSNDDYWEDTVEYWQTITQDSDEFANDINTCRAQGIPLEDCEIKRAMLANTQVEIVPRLAGIIKLLGGEASVGEYVVPPYVDKLVFDFYKTDQEDQLIFRDPDGVPLTPDREDVDVQFYGEAQAIQTIEIVRPDPGIYWLETTADEEDYRITQITIFVNARLAKPEGNLLQFKEADLEISLVDSDGNPLPDYGSDRYALSVDTALLYEEEAVPLNLAFDAPNSSLIGKFIPMGAGDYTLKVGATALDDKGEEVQILYQDLTQFFIEVDPVGVQINTAQSTRENCPVMVDVPFTVALNLINATTNDPVAVSLPVNWQVDSEMAADFSMTAVEDGSIYELQVLPDETGEYAIDVKASAPSQLDATPYLFFDNVFTTQVADSTVYVMDNFRLEPKMKPFALVIDNFLNRLFGNPENRDVIVGRRFFIFPNKVLLYADFINQDTGNPGDKDLLPDVNFIHEGSQENYPGTYWKQDADNHFYTELTYGGFGDYRLVVDEQETACDVVLSVAPYTDGWRISPGLSERGLVLLGVVLGLLIILWLIRFLLCHCRNRLRGYIMITNSQGEATYYKNTSKRSCWTLKPSRPTENCMIFKIKINGALRAKGKFKITYYWTEKGKVVRESRIKSLDRWTPIVLRADCKIDWKPRFNFKKSR